MNRSTHPKPRKPTKTISNRSPKTGWEEGGRQPFPRMRGSIPTVTPKPSSPVVRSRNLAVAPIIRGYCPNRLNALDEIAKLSGARPSNWKKPKFGQFEYWLGHNCGWISDEELQQDTINYQTKRNIAFEKSQRFSQRRFSWLESPKHEAPADTGEYIPQIDMKLVKDRNLSDSSRRIAMFVLRHTYQDNRSGRFIAMTVSFIMQGLSLSRRTVQRSLTLLETRGYFRCEVAKGNETRMCIGLVIHLLESLFPKHHRHKWPEHRRNRGASKLPQKQNQFYTTTYEAKIKVSRLQWALRCMNAITRKSVSQQNSTTEFVRGGRFQPLDASFLLPLIGKPIRNPETGYGTIGKECS